MSDEQKRDTVTDEMLERLDLLANRIVLRDGDSEIAVVPVLVAEIKRQRRILSALREPNEAVVEKACLALFGAYWSHDDPGDVVWRADARQRFITQLCAAVAAAEQEVGRE